MNTIDQGPSAKTAVVAVCVNTSDGGANVKNVSAPAFANTSEGGAGAKIVKNSRWDLEVLVLIIGQILFYIYK